MLLRFAPRGEKENRCTDEREWKSQLLLPREFENNSNRSWQSNTAIESKENYCSLYIKFVQKRILISVVSESDSSAHTQWVMIYFAHIRRHLAFILQSWYNLNSPTTFYNTGSAGFLADEFRRAQCIDDIRGGYIIILLQNSHNAGHVFNAFHHDRSPFQHPPPTSDIRHTSNSVALIDGEDTNTQRAARI